MEITPKLSVTEDKIRLLTVKTDMFKTACLTLNVLVPMGEYAAEYAVLSSYLVHSSKKIRFAYKAELTLGGALRRTFVGQHFKTRRELSYTAFDNLHRRQSHL